MEERIKSDRAMFVFALLYIVSLIFAIIYGIKLLVKIHKENEKAIRKVYISFLITMAGFSLFDDKLDNSLGNWRFLIGMVVAIAGAGLSYFKCRQVLAYQRDEDYLEYNEYDPDKIMRCWYVLHIVLVVGQLMRLLYLFLEQL